ncbi:phosphatidylinositol 4-kinase alpha [Trichonephila clavipes]|nr:phosphatidylinositol 4-kinase alpha [Trichonephila clavipes]
MRKDRPQLQFKVNKWTGTLNEKATGPFKLRKTLNRDNCLSFLRKHFSDLLEDVAFNIHRDMWFQQEGYPAHYACPVRQCSSTFLSPRTGQRLIILPRPAEGGTR